MALIIYDNRIEISIPNSEAMICAQHVGIKDRTVGSYYMSESAGDVIAFLNNLKGEFYIDFYRTIQNPKQNNLSTFYIFIISDKLININKFKKGSHFLFFYLSATRQKNW